MGTGSGFGSADLILVAVGLEGVDAIGVAFRKGGRYVDCLAQDHGGVPLADALFEDAPTLVRGDDVEERGHHVHGGDDNFSAVRQDQGDLVALEGVELLARDHQRRPFFCVAISYNRRSTAVQR